MTNVHEVLRQIEQDGFAVVRGVLSEEEIDRLRSELRAALGAAGGPAVRSRAGAMVAARNVLELYPPAATVWQRGILPDLLAVVLVSDYGVVRALFFDKPPGSTWSLAWHKDLTIAVQDHSLPSAAFAKPTLKAGVPHVEAPTALLERMLTLRIHLDDVTDENGPLQVVPGSHRSGKQSVPGEAPAVSILAAAGDVLLMRPLVSHSSGASLPDTERHRRILHLEFCGSENLPDGYRWRDFVRPSTAAAALRLARSVAPNA